ncbi:MAG: hypothetical protein ABSA59_22105 [Terriglobia bacterium]|jgi:hypothetical protein
MGSFLGSITIGVLGNLAADLVRGLGRKACAPIDNAITETAEAFPQYLDLSTTLRQ